VEQEAELLAVLYWPAGQLVQARLTEVDGVVVTYWPALQVSHAEQDEDAAEEA
jgi:hypothetical protein